MQKCLNPKFYVIYVMLLLFVSCYEKQDGCLDIRAENYDFSADKSCDDCCAYPTMSLRIQHNWGDELLISDSLYVNILGQQIQIIDAAFYLSNIRLISANGSYKVSEEITVESKTGNSSTITDDITFVQKSRLNYAIGSFEYAQDFTGMDFTFGINGNFIAEDESKSFVVDDDFIDTDTYIHTNFKMDYVLPQISQDTLSFEIKDIDKTLEVSLIGDFNLPLGIDFSIGLMVNYFALLGDIDLENIQGEDAKFIANLSDFFHN